MSSSATRIKEILAEMRKVTEAATSGPWQREDGTLLVWSHDENERPHKPIVTGESSNAGGFQRGLYRDFEPRDNCDFIAQSRAWLPSLVDALEIVVQQRNAYRDLYWRAANSGIIEQKVLRESDDAEIVSKLEGKP